MRGGREGTSVGRDVGGRHPLPSSGHGGYFLASLWKFSWEEAPHTCPSSSQAGQEVLLHASLFGFGSFPVLVEGGWSHKARAPTVRATGLSAQGGKIEIEG